ncbi:hypothetical protein ACEZ3G_05765 [Maribacter algicola]|uniref:Uncharacterized protein n=1 Tax=Meishania litoralis TaxID=3434685 RepID=A0ACC7LID8_9FLAO
MWQIILDFIVVFFLIFLSRIAWIIGKKKEQKQIRLFFKSISIFILLHLLVFPLIYMKLINQNENSIRIEKNIISFERNEKMKQAFEQKMEIENRLIKKHKPELTDFTNKYSNQLSQIPWNYLDNKRILKFDSFMVTGKTMRQEIPGGHDYKEIEIYDHSNIKLLELNIFNDKENLYDIIKQYLTELEIDKKRINKKIDDIEKNKFWNYRQILPYTLNILFTDNFNPQSRIANFIYFLHNIVVLGFLLTIIINLFQFYLLNNK